MPRVALAAVLGAADWELASAGLRRSSSWRGGGEGTTAAPWEILKISLDRKGQDGVEKVDPSGMAAAAIWSAPSARAETSRTFVASQL